MIEELLAEDGSTVQPGKVILRIRVGAAGESKPKAAAAPAPPPPKAEATSPKHVEAPIPVSATQKVEKLVTSSVSSIKSSIDNIADNLGFPGHGSSRKETRVKMNRMRMRIAERLKDAQNTYAMLTTFNEVDMRLGFH